MDEVDELLLEQDLLSPSSASKTLKTSSSKKKKNNSKEDRKGAKTKTKDASPDVINKKTASKNTEKLRDSVLEKLLNGVDLKDIENNGTNAGDKKDQEKKK